MDNFFKYAFLRSEQLLEFKIKFIVYVLFMNIFIFSVLTLLYFFKIFYIPFVLVVLNFVYIALSVIGIYLMTKSKVYYKIIAYITIAALLFIITLNIILSCNDVLAPIWYLPVIVGSYIALSIAEGIVISIISIALVIFMSLNHSFCCSLNLESLDTLLISILSISIIGYSASARLVDYDEDNENIKNELKKLADIDYLTHIYNRRAFFESSRKFLSFARRNGLDISVIILDIDDFRIINDTEGIEQGDYILKHLTELIKGSIRESDVFGRTGGDEFAILLLNDDLERCKIVVNKIRKIINQDTSIDTTVSMGICDNQKEIYDIEILLREADQALDRVKKNGKNQVGIAN